MPLDATTLAGAIKMAQLAEPDLHAIDGPALDAQCRAIATAVIDHITANAVVVPGVTLIAPGGMTPAPVTGTARIT